MAEKTTVMILNVDLQCSSCYKKVKKVICKFPQITDQKYFEKENKVFITVVCCDPEKIRDKLCRKGCGVIKSIEIVEPPKPKPPPPEKPKPPPEKPKPPPEKPKDPPPALPPPPEKPKPPPEKPKPPPEKPKDPPPAPPPPNPVIVVPCNPCYPTHPPTGFCCGPCSEGIPGGPCYGLYGRPPPPPPPPPRPCYEDFFGCRCGQPGGYYGCRCGYNYYYCQDNSSCTIM